MASGVAFGLRVLPAGGWGWQDWYGLDAMVRLWESEIWTCGWAKRYRAGGHGRRRGSGWARPRCDA